MKKYFVGFFMFLFSLFSFAAEADYHIGVVSGTVSQSEDSLRGAEELVKMYGASDKGGMVTHVTYPDNFMQEMETTISQMVGLADDPKMKVVLVAEAVPGTVEAFRRIREKRPDILLIANAPHEDPEIISDAADLVTNPDNVARGYLIVKAAKEMGATKFMHISFPRHLSYELLSRRRNIMAETAKDLGMEFIDMSAPDPVSDVGVAGAQQYILEQVPNWLEKYGKDTAFFATNDAHTEPLLKRVAEVGGYFVEADLPSPTMGYPGALGIKFSEDEKGNFYKESGIICGITAAVWFICCIVLHPGIEGFFNYMIEQYRTPGLVKVVGTFCSIILVFAAAFRIMPMMEKWKFGYNKLCYYSKQISKMYAVHIGVYWTLAGFADFYEFGVKECLILSVAALIVTDLLVHGYIIITDKIKNRK